jgi:hypothetical protein
VRWVMAAVESISKPAPTGWWFGGLDRSVIGGAIDSIDTHQPHSTTINRRGGFSHQFMHQPPIPHKTRPIAPPTPRSIRTSNRSIVPIVPNRTNNPPIVPITDRSPPRSISTNEFETIDRLVVGRAGFVRWVMAAVRSIAKPAPTDLLIICKGRIVSAF